MKLCKRSLRGLAHLVLLAVCACALVLLPARAADSPPVPLINVTPAEPEVDQTTWQTELAARRARVAEQLGPKSVLVLFSGEPRVYAGDVDYEFRQENNLYHLTQLK